MRELTAADLKAAAFLLAHTYNIVVPAEMPGCTTKLVCGSSRVKYSSLQRRVPSSRAMSASCRPNFSLIRECRCSKLRATTPTLIFRLRRNTLNGIPAISNSACCTTKMASKCNFYKTRVFAVSRFSLMYVRHSQFTLNTVLSVFPVSRVIIQLHLLQFWYYRVQEHFKQSIKQLLVPFGVLQQLKYLAHTNLAVSLA